MLPTPSQSKLSQNRWVQTDRATHEEWARLTVANPKAGALLHILAWRVGEQNAVVASHKTLATLLGVRSVTTIKTAIAALVAGNWLEVRQIGENGTVNGYVLNDRVIWHGPRDGLRYSLFSAAVIARSSEQPDNTDLGQQEPLRRLPRQFFGEQQLPSGDGLPPPSEPSLPGMEPDLPALHEPADREPMDEAQSLASLTGGLLDRLR